MLDGHVLVLNRLYQALQVATVREAFVLLASGRVVAVDSDFRTLGWDDWRSVPPGPEERSVATPRERIRIPRVVLFPRVSRQPRRHIRFNRRNVYQRDRYRCQYCGKVHPPSRLNLDHVVPLSKGGKTSWENVVCSCVPCNRRKGDRLPREAGMRLIARPRHPRWNPLVHASDRHTYDFWRTFLDAAYWTVELDEGEGADGA
jgi:5-methylcytosine-specific restriction endonuclease McrA